MRLFISALRERCSFQHWGRSVHFNSEGEVFITALKERCSLQHWRRGVHFSIEGEVFITALKERCSFQHWGRVVHFSIEGELFISALRERCSFQHWGRGVHYAIEEEVAGDGGPKVHVSDLVYHLKCVIACYDAWRLWTSWPMFKLWVARWPVFSAKSSLLTLRVFSWTFVFPLTMNSAVHVHIIQVQIPFLLHYI
jgi:hypothetical protein